MTLEHTTPPRSRIVAIPTAATDAFLDRPGLFLGKSAAEIVELKRAARVCRTAGRRAYIEAMLERLADLRDQLVAKLDALDADPDLEDDELGEDQGDREPSLGSSNRVDQRAWSLGSCNDAEQEHDGREPECEDEGDDSDREAERCCWISAH